MDLSELIDTHRGGRSYPELSRDCGGSPTDKRLQQLVRSPIKNFPDPGTVVALARGLKVSQSAVVLAAAESLGLDVRSPTLRLVELLPVGARDLTEPQAAAIAHLVRTFTEPVVVTTNYDQWLDDEIDGPAPKVADVLAHQADLRAVAEGGDPDDARAVDELARRTRERHDNPK